MQFSNLSLAFLIGFVVSPAAAQDAWQPKDNPSPESISILERSIDEDIEAGNFETAHRKFMWYYDHALDYDQKITGTRNSFFLSDWFEFSEKYEPAKKELQKRRDALIAELEKEMLDIRGFQDLIAMLQWSNWDPKFATRVFELLEENQPWVALRTFDELMEVLVRDEQYELCTRYLRPQEFFLKSREEVRGQHDPVLSGSFVQSRFEKRMNMLIKILIETGQMKNAEHIYRLVLEQTPDFELPTKYQGRLQSKPSGG